MLRLMILIYLTLYIMASLIYLFKQIRMDLKAAKSIRNREEHQRYLRRKYEQSN